MIKKSIFRQGYRWFGAIVLGIGVFFLASCEERIDPMSQGNTGIKGEPFNPGKPVTISSFIPESGGMGTRLILYGENFGADTSKIKITVGGIATKAISTDGKHLYCMVPGKAYEGSIEVKIVDNDGDLIATTIAPTKFQYERRRLVTTLLGVRNPDGSYTVRDGPFDDCGGVQRCGWLSYDPKNKNHLYFVADGGTFRMMNFETRTITTLVGAGQTVTDRSRTITWTLSGDTMIIATDRGQNTDPSTLFSTRNQNFRTWTVLTRNMQCNGAVVHPVNGEMYLNSYSMGQFYRWDFKTNGPLQQLFTIQDQAWEYNIQVHPTGNYAYIVVVNRHYILRTNYDWERKQFTVPFIICGEPGVQGWEDGVGKKVRMRSPYQGAFVKNPDYAGKADEYDFYFTEQNNHCVRILTPEGKVTTYAGRGSTGLDANPYGYINGDLRLEARFDQPQGLVYDEENNCFYVGDYVNRCIRKIALEE